MNLGHYRPLSTITTILDVELGLVLRYFTRASWRRVSPDDAPLWFSYRLEGPV